MTSRQIVPQTGAAPQPILATADYLCDAADTSVTIQAPDLTITLPQNPTAGLTSVRILAGFACELTAGPLSPPLSPSDPLSLDAGESLTASYAGPSVGWELSSSSASSSSGLAVSVATGAELTATPTSVFLLGAVGYVQSFGAYWSLEPAGALSPDGSTVLGSDNPDLVWERGATAVAYSSQRQLFWYVDRQDVTGKADDENDGLTPETPLLHKAEIARRWGTWKPSFNGIFVTVQYLSPDTPGDSSDPGLFEPVLLNAALFLQYAAFGPPAFTGTIATLTHKNSTGSPGNTLEASFTTLTGALAENQILVNASRENSRAPAQRILTGATWQIGQPLEPFTPGMFPLPTEVDTWAVGDAVTGYAPLLVCQGIVGGQAVGVSQTTFGPSHVLQQMTVDTFFSTLSIDFSANLCAADCVFNSGVAGRGVPPVSLFQTFLGCVFTAQCTLDAPQVQFAGGIVAGGGAMHQAAFSNNVILAGPLIAFDSDLDDCELFLDDGAVFDACGHTFLGGADIPAHVYGRGTYNQLSGVSELHETAAAHFFCAITIAGSSNGYAMTTGEGGAVTVTRIALTGAAIDAAGGLAFVGGSSIQVTGAAP